MTGKEYLASLEAELKAQGLPMVEALAEKVYASVRKVDLAAAAASGNPLIMAIVPVAHQALDSIALPAIDKIDGQPG